MSFESKNTNNAERSISFSGTIIFCAILIFGLPVVASLFADGFTALPKWVLQVVGFSIPASILSSAWAARRGAEGPYRFLVIWVPLLFGAMLFSESANISDGPYANMLKLFRENYKYLPVVCCVLSVIGPFSLPLKDKGNQDQEP